jgi:ABC-type sugar transport system ATPase subunit
MLVLRAVEKRFGETQALRGLNLEAAPGEILGVAGPNGAGKSTLIRILSGEETADRGEILLDGSPWLASGTREQAAVVHQEPLLFPNLTIFENLLIGREESRFGKPRIPEKHRLILSELGILRHGNRLVANCLLGVRQRAEIARALAKQASVFLFDEPNSALTESESRTLFEYMHDLASKGHVILLVSHRLAELVVHASRVVVIREGIVAAELQGPGLSQEAIARELVVGLTQVSLPAKPAVERSGRAILRVASWTHRKRLFTDVALVVAEQEIVAVVGVEGSGARELVASLAGFAPAEGEFAAGDGALNARGKRPTVAYLPPDRRSSIFFNYSVGDNLVSRLGRPDIASLWGFLRLGAMARLGQALRERFRVRTQSLRQPVRALSGGNQQKVAIASAIARRPSLLVLQEPTRGVDIGSKAEIYAILRDYAQQGNGVIAFCTEIPEVYELATWVIVVTNGRATEPIRVAAYPDIASLTTAIAKIEHTLPEADATHRPRPSPRPGK